MWYIAYLLFAETTAEDGRNFSCETCDVLLNASNAEEALKAAQQWAAEHERSTTYNFVGVEELQWLSEERPGHGDELAGTFSQEVDIWSRCEELIPEKSELSAISFEGPKGKTPIKELLSGREVENLKKYFGTE